MSDEFDTFHSEIEAAKQQVSRMITGLSTISPEQRPEAFERIERQFSEINEQIEQLNESKIMWGSEYARRANSYLSEVRQQVSQLEDRYNSERRRLELFRGATQRHNLAGGGQSHREALLGQREIINEGGRELELMKQAGQDIENAGNGILDEFGRQREVVERIGGNLQRLNEGVDIGDQAMNRIISRERLKVIVVWIAVGLAIVGLCVFLYFVFR